MMNRNKQIDIKAALALAGTFSFLMSCAKACLLPFLTLYFRQLGLTPAMTGLIMVAKHLISLIWSPLASLLSKHYNKRRLVINSSLVCSAAVALVMLLIPPIDVHIQSSYCNTTGVSTAGKLLGMNASSPGKVNTPPHNVGPSNTSLYLPDSVTSHPSLSQNNQSVVLSNSLELQNSTVMDANKNIPLTQVRNKRSKTNSKNHQKPRDAVKQEGRSKSMGGLNPMDDLHQLLFLMLIVVAVWQFVSAPLEWTADDGLYEYLDFVDASDRYSSTTVWRLLGSAIGVGAVGSLVSQFNCFIFGHTSRSAMHFFCYAGLTAVTLPVAAVQPLYVNKKQDRASGLLKAMQLVRGSPHALLCAFTTLLVGVAGSAVNNFLLWQMQDGGSSEMHMGLALALALLSQATFPLLVSQVSKLLSPKKILVVGAATLSMQCFYYSFLWGPWAVLPAQLLSCFSSGALWWAVKIQCDDVATPGAEQSVSRIYSALLLDLGSGLGSLAGGFVVQRFGLTWLFRGAAVGLMVWCLCLPLLQWKAPHQRRINYSRLLAADASEASDSESEQERDWLDKAMDNNNSSNFGKRIKH
ncbi:major facilitator superfamily domain-containing protein 6-like [Thalassophryne amazonica]|uniref:major facilitator superfamily domain-containing protein 6-like n=1 Tax=Thalassophryne amazonica TaxID=390379 RepID=UPI0014711F0B|nr:major facilitator superfamily domain-containing protein 6-like [Thalassophryne amazonica]